MTIEVLAAAMFACLALGVFSGYPVALMLVAAGFLGFLGALATGVAEVRNLGLYYLRVRGALTNEDVQFISVPLLILLGVALNESRMAATMFRVLGHWLRKVPGQYAIVTLLLGLLLAPAAGVIGASVVAVGLVAFRPMMAAGYPARLAGGAVAAAGAVGVIFPPAIMLFFVANTLRLQISLAYLAMLGPVLLLVVTFSLYFAMRAPANRPIQPDSDETPAGWSAVILPTALVLAIPASVITGLATLTEAAGLGAALTLLVAFARRQMTLLSLHRVMMKSAELTAMIFFIVVGATIFSLSFNLLNGPTMIFEGIDALSLDRWHTLALLLGVILMLGFVFDWIEILLVFLPILLPIFNGLDFSDYVGSGYLATAWMGALIVLALQTSFLTPPFGYALFFARMVAPSEVLLGQIFRGAIPLVLLEIVVIVALAAFPQLVVWLPSHMLDLTGLLPVLKGD